MIGLVIMQFIDALFLSWYSPDAIAAVVPAGMASTLIIATFQGTAGFTSTLVAHYIGAKKAHRAYTATWQGIYFSCIAGVIVFGVGFLAKPLFTWAGHAPEVRIFEQTYFAILCWGAITTIIGSALSGFFSGQGKTTLLMIVQVSGLVLNALLDYVLVFGKWGAPVLGVAGAAIGTVIAQGFVALILFILFLLFKRDDSSAWKLRGFEKTLFVRLLNFGLPNGLRFAFEMLAWTLFTFFIGRIGVSELAATNIAFRINEFAFFPIIGLAQAVGVLVGQAQGSGNPQKTVRLTYVGFLMAEIWMISVAALLILFPVQIYDLFRAGQTENFNIITSIGVILLRFVAVYSLLDAGNIVFVSVLQSAGDTRWTMFFSIIAHTLFLAALAYADFIKLNIWYQWLIATVFVMIAAVTWFLRFLSGKWKTIKVIEHNVKELYG